MSFTARERYNPPPRRKACAACIKAKRRCDFALPSCLRCEQRNIPCKYPCRAPRNDHERRRIPGNSDAAIARTSPPDMSEVGWEESSSTCVDTCSSDNADATSTIFHSTPEELDHNPHNLDHPLRNEPPIDLFTEGDPLTLIFQPNAIAPPVTKEWEVPANVVWDKAKYTIEEVKKAPARMVYELGTPWCHPLVYEDEMPQSMRDAMACCSLYLAKNRVNSRVIFRSIESKAQELLRAPIPITPLESLAHTQSLLLYQIIRLFDGDIAARVAAERMIPSLETSALCLLSYCSFDIPVSPCPADLPLFPLTETKVFWKEWALAESTRRTIIFTFLLLSAYRVLAGFKNLVCDAKMGLYHSWTVSAHLWGAKSAVEFAEAWKSRRHFVVKDAQYGSVLAEANADDVDEFGKMFLSALLGFEEAQGWFKSKGGDLVTAGCSI